MKHNEISDLVDEVETLIASMLCGDASYSSEPLVDGGRRGKEMAEVDAWSRVDIGNMSPDLSYAYTDDDRFVALDSRLLLGHVPDIIGDCAEVSVVSGDVVKWTGFRRIRRVPRHVAVVGRLGAAYEMHHRRIFKSGASSYQRCIVAVSPSGRPLPCIAEGSRGGGANNSEHLVMAASVIEDTHRPGCFTATVRDVCGLVVAVPYGEQMEAFAARDAPLTQAGKRRAIIHWVSKHTRATRGERVGVRKHLRGVEEFEIAGLRVRLEANDHV